MLRHLLPIFTSYDSDRRFDLPSLHHGSYNYDPDVWIYQIIYESDIRFSSSIFESELPGHTSLFLHDQHITDIDDDASVVHVYHAELPALLTAKQTPQTLHLLEERLPDIVSSLPRTYVLALAVPLPEFSFVQCRSPCKVTLTCKMYSTTCAVVSSDMSCTLRDRELAERLSSKFSSQILSQW